MVDKLHKYAKKGKYRKLKKVLKYCVDVDEFDDAGKTALYYAYEAGHKKCIKTLLKHGADAERVQMQNFAHITRGCYTDVSARSVPRISMSDLMFAEDDGKQFSCGALMIYRHAFWGKTPVAAKYSNTVPSITTKDIRSTQKRLLENELEILRKINFINVIKLMAYIETDNLNRPVILLFEPVSNNSLANALYNKEESLTTLQICSVLHDVLLALQHIHSKLIIHNYINAQSVYRLDKKTVLADFQYAQDIEKKSLPISSIVSQIPWMAPAQAEGALPDVASDTYSFGALIWELTSGRPPCHWTEAESNLDEESIFVFPFEDSWNVVLRNLISFCVQPFPEARPDHEVLIEIISEEQMRLKEIEEYVCDVKLSEGFAKEMSTSFHLEDLYTEDLKSLKKGLASCDLSLSKAQDILTKSKKYARKSWAKQTLVVKELEKIAYGKGSSRERQKIAKHIIEECEFPLRGDDGYMSRSHLNKTMLLRAEKNPSRSSGQKLDYLTEIASKCQRNAWAKVCTQKRLVDTRQILENKMQRKTNQKTDF